MHEERRRRLAEFTSWAAEHITGDEKGASLRAMLGLA
jgi:hypothetical protein